jgi:hypothetical protein
LRHFCPLISLGYPLAVVDDRGAVPGERFVHLACSIRFRLG